MTGDKEKTSCVCQKCGRDCKTKMALDKHQSVCGLTEKHEKFTNRFDGEQRCPKCSQYGKSFYKKDKETLVCLGCGIHFTPDSVLRKLREEVSKIAWKRP